VLREQINTALKEALKSGDKRRVSTLRLINSAIKNADIDARTQGRQPVSDQELQGLLQKMLRQRREAIALYDQGGRTDLADQEREEMAIIGSYLPKQLPDDEAERLLASLVQEAGADGPKAMGKVMGLLKERHPGAIEGGKASAILKRLLAK
jgi:uncharacterized protein